MGFRNRKLLENYRRYHEQLAILRWFAWVSGWTWKIRWNRRMEWPWYARSWKWRIEPQWSARSFFTLVPLEISITHWLWLEQYFKARSWDSFKWRIDRNQPRSVGNSRKEDEIRSYCKIWKGSLGRTIIKQSICFDILQQGCNWSLNWYRLKRGPRSRLSLLYSKRPNQA